MQKRADYNLCQKENQKTSNKTKKCKKCRYLRPPAFSVGEVKQAVCQNKHGKQNANDDEFFLHQIPPAN